MTLKKTVLMVAFQHYSLNDKNNSWVSFVPPRSLPESGHLWLFLPSTNCCTPGPLHACVPEEKGHKSSSFVWNSSEPGEGPQRNKEMSLAIASTACGSSGKGWTQKQTERQGLSLSSLLNVLLERKMEIRSSSMEHREVHWACRTRSTVGSPLPLKCTH